MYISLLKLVLFTGYCGYVRAVIKSCTSLCMFQNKVIVAGSLWRQPGSVDVVTCAILCMTDFKCLYFSYSRSEGICLGYGGNVLYYRDKLKDSKGNAVFRTCRDVSKHGAVCKEKRDCRIHLSVCYAGVCLCKPGFYYSPTLNTCLRYCEEIGEGMDLYKGVGIYGYNDKKLDNTTLASCYDFCVREKEFTCLTAEWSQHNSKCCLSKHGYLDVPFFARQKDLGSWSLAQRRCK